MIQVKSSLIEAVDYNQEKQILKVQFKNGDLWQYEEVDKFIWDEMINAKSIGKFFLEVIKGKYTSTKL